MSKLRKRLNDLLLYLGSRRLLGLVSIRPFYAIMNVTENCNGRCMTCHAWRNKSVDELTTKELIDVLRQLKSIGVRAIRFTGGEALIRSDLGVLIKECNLLGFEMVSVATNGLLLKERAKELIENGVTHIWVSIDGLEETNNMIRGVPFDYKKSIKGIQTVNKIKDDDDLHLPIVIVGTTLLRQNIDEIPSLIELCQSMGVRWGFNLIEANDPRFEEIDIYRDFAVRDEKKIDETIDYLKKTRRERPELIDGACDHVLEDARSYLKGIASNKRHVWSPQTPCLMGYKTMIIDSHGDVRCCYILDPVGNTRKEKLREIIESKKYRNLAEKMYKRECPGCTLSRVFSVRHLKSLRDIRRIRACTSPFP